KMPANKASSRSGIGLHQIRQTCRSAAADGYFFISSFFMPSLDIESFDIVSLDMLSFFMESLDIESFDIESFGIVSFFMLSWAKAAGDSPSAIDTMDADRMRAARLIMRLSPRSVSRWRRMSPARTSKEDAACYAAWTRSDHESVNFPGAPAHLEAPRR